MAKAAAVSVANTKDIAAKTLGGSADAEKFQAAVKRQTSTRESGTETDREDGKPGPKLIAQQLGGTGSTQEIHETDEGINIFVIGDPVDGTPAETQPSIPPSRSPFGTVEIPSKPLFPEPAEKPVEIDPFGQLRDLMRYIEDATGIPPGGTQVRQAKALRNGTTVDPSIRNTGLAGRIIPITPADQPRQLGQAHLTGDEGGVTAEGLRPNTPVRKGDVIGELSNPLVVRDLEIAKGDLQAAVARFVDTYGGRGKDALNEARGAVRTAEANLQAATERLRTAKARSDMLERAADAIPENRDGSGRLARATAKDELATAQEQLSVASVRLQQSRSDLERLQSRFGGNAEQIVAQVRAGTFTGDLGDLNSLVNDIRAAQARVAVAEKRVEALKIRSPVDGLINTSPAQQQSVHPQFGTPIRPSFDPKDFVTITTRIGVAIENQAVGPILEQLQPGAKVDLYDPVDGTMIGRGKVVNLSSGLVDKPPVVVVGDLIMHKDRAPNLNDLGQVLVFPFDELPLRVVRENPSHIRYEEATAPSYSASSDPLPTMQQVVHATVPVFADDGRQRHRIGSIDLSLLGSATLREVKDVQLLRAVFTPNETHTSGASAALPNMMVTKLNGGANTFGLPARDSSALLTISNSLLPTNVTISQRFGLQGSLEFRVRGVPASIDGGLSRQTSQTPKTQSSIFPIHAVTTGDLDRPLQYAIPTEFTVPVVPDR